MKKPKSSRGLIIKNNKILLIHRKKPSRDYYVIPGGQIEEYETSEDTLIRKIKEETNLNIISFKKFTEFEDEQKYSYYYFVEKYIGEPKITGKEKEKNSALNQYKLEWINLNEIKKINLIPIQIKNKLIDYLS